MYMQLNPQNYISSNIFGVAVEENITDCKMYLLRHPVSTMRLMILTDASASVFGYQRINLVVIT